MSGILQILLGGSQAPAVDPYFYSVTSLLHGDGTNGGQNNTFLDSSSNNFTITRNGNTTQGSFSPFSQTGWSNYFDGSSLLTFASSANYVPGSGEFCLECWFMPTSTGTDRWLIGNRNNNYVPFAIVYTGSSAPTALLFYMSSNGSTWDVINGGYAYGVVANRWNHLALVRSGTSIIAYINGIGTTLATSSANFSTAQPFYVGGSPAAGDPEFVGYISNVRFVKGSTPYSGSTITVPTTPLTAITNTQLLTSQSNRFLDNSTNAVTPSITGSPSVQPFSPFNPTTPYSTSAVGGSGYFDGSGDYLTVASNSVFNIFNQTNATVEFWFNPSAYTTDQDAICYYVDGNNFWMVQFAGGQANKPIKFYTLNAGVQVSLDVNQSSTTFLPNQWNHCAFVKSGSTWSSFINGSRVATAGTAPTINFTGTFYIGSRNTTTNLITGYLAGVRITNTVEYSGTTYTVPTAPLTAISGTGFLTNFTNGAIFDNAAVADYETVGNAQISTSVKKYGTGSIYLDGTGDYLDSPPSRNFDFDAGDFTIEAWIYTTSLATEQGICANQDNGTNTTLDGWVFNVGTTGALAFLDYTNASAAFSVVSSASAIAINTWYHVAVCRVAGTVNLYINGTAVATGTRTASIPVSTSNQPFRVGNWRYATDTNREFTGYIDDLRISKGIGRYPYNFTPPTAEFPNIGGTVTLTADPYYEYTALLLPGNGTNGAQNNTFLDSSTNAFSITRNGNTTQGTFSPFSQTGWGNFFSTTGSYLSIADDADFALPGDFTIETWLYPTNLPSSTGSAAQSYCRVFSFGTYNAANSFGLEINSNDSGNIRKLVSWYNGTSYSLSGNNAITTNQWTHVALVRSGTTITCYVNGSSTGTIAGASATIDRAQPFYIATLQGFEADASAQYAGYISNFSILKGTAKYTSNFTPSTTPLAVNATNQILLTCAANRFFDSDTTATAKVITAVGSPSVQSFSPFNPTAAWSAATNGGSGYFDGSGDYLTIGGNSNLAFGTGDFTIEFWAYINSFASAFQHLYDGRPATTDGSYPTIRLNSATLEYVVGGAVQITGSAVTGSTWNHFAVCRSGASTKMFLNGIQTGSTYADSNNYLNPASRPAIGGWGYNLSGGYSVSGYMGDVRSIKGTALYTANFTPPTAPLTAITNTQLLCNFTNAGIYDATSKNDLETVGNAQISTAQSKFGGSSMYFDGSGDYLLAPSNVDLQMGTGDFTVEVWAYITAAPSVGARCRIYSFQNHAASQAAFTLAYINTSGTIYGDAVIRSADGTGLTIYTGTTAIPLNTWTHLAFTRYASTGRLFVNGILQDTETSQTQNLSQNVSAAIGAAANNTEFVTGYIQDLRVTKGIARYTTNFTPPTTAFLTL